MVQSAQENTIERYNNSRALLDPKKRTVVLVTSERALKLINNKYIFFGRIIYFDESGERSDNEAIKPETYLKA